uniref:BACK domain-containing protein n=1 Tax=Angiostrongylus cantonensis TaxID=6313 RepID=A0A0K0CX75_ANGCA
MLRCLQKSGPQVSAVGNERAIHLSGELSLRYVNRCLFLQLFLSSDLDQYEKELSILCSFQACYLQCMIPVVDEVCVSGLSARTIELIRSFVHWHATDIADWHAVAGHFDELPESCRKIAGATVQPDPVLQLINRA